MKNDTGGKIGMGVVLWVALAVVVVLIVAAIAMNKAEAARKAGEKLKASESKPVAVQAVKIHPREIRDSVVIPGRVEAVERVVLANEIAGRIVELPVDKGAKVEVGQLLLKLDSRSADEGLKRAEIMDRDAEEELTRWVELNKTGAVSTSDFETITRNRQMAAIALAEAKVRVSQCEIRSPIPGMVNDKRAEKGEYLNGGITVFEVVNVADVRVVFSIPERDVVHAAVDSAITFDVEVVPDRVFTGKVTFVASAAGRDSGSFAAELRAPNAGLLLRPGMVARVTLARKVNRQAIVLPLSSVIPQKGDYAVFIVDKGRAARRLVKIEQIQGSEAIIASGIAEGEEVVTEGCRALVDGMPIKVVPAQGQPAAVAPEGK